MKILAFDTALDACSVAVCVTAGMCWSVGMNTSQKVTRRRWFR